MVAAVLDRARTIGSISAREIAQNIIGLMDEEAGLRHDATGTPTTTGFLHGAGGVLSYPGVDPEVFSTIMGTRRGIIGELPVKQSRYMTPFFETITGMGAGSGSEPAASCDPAPIGGILSGAIVTAPYGKYKRATAELDITRLGQLNDAADPVDLRLMNRMSATGIPGIDASTPAGAISREMTMRLWSRAVAFDRLLKVQAWTGNPANNNGGGGYKEFAGFPLLLNSTQKDAITGSAVAALAPDVRSFQLIKVESGGTQLVNLLSSMLRNLEYKAGGMGLDPVRHVIVMKEELYWALTNIWPCAYYTTLCSFPATANGTLNQNIDLGDQIALRDRMRNGRFLLIDGREYDVIFDDGLPEYSNTTLSGVSNGCFASDIYIIPMSVMGGRAVTYMEVFPFDNEEAQAAINYFPNTPIRTWGDGAFIETERVTGTCIQWEAQISPRIIVRTPFLAGRITNVQYCPAKHADQPFPTDPYYVAGGATTRSTPVSVTLPWA